jgi:HPt (histidine-containing phosphotransfer) domain-containing protein
MVTQGDFDIDAANRIRDLGGDALLTRIAIVFNDYAAARVADATAGGSAGDLPRVAAAAHALRSSAANVGARRLLAIATDLEHAARDRRADVIPGLVTNLRVAYDGARVYVHGLIPGGVS